jgi:predicted amidohydrolase
MNQFILRSTLARAIESQCYVLAAAQYGKHNDKRESFGHSLAVDPWGKVVADAGGYALDGQESGKVLEAKIVTPCIVTCEIDLDLVESVRQRMPLQMHRSNASFSFSVT